VQRYGKNLNRANFLAKNFIDCVIFCTFAPKYKEKDDEKILDNVVRRLSDGTADECPGSEKSQP
jgi:hypothetical protein